MFDLLSPNALCSGFHPTDKPDQKLEQQLLSLQSLRRFTLLLGKERSLSVRCPLCRFLRQSLSSPIQQHVAVSQHVQSPVLGVER
jgi:hypothetical protein